MRTLLLLLALVGLAKGAPFLVCDPYPAGLAQATMPVSFIIKGLTSAPFSVPVQTNQDGTLQLHYDLGALSNGTYTVIVDAVNAFGGVSPDSSPFTFTSGVPAMPTNIRIVP